MPLIPNQIDKDSTNVPKGEREIFSRFKQTYIPNEDYAYLFHSLELQESAHKLKGEADFVYLDEEFLLFFEVKGGTVKYKADSNSWLVMGGKKRQDPFKQVTDALFTVRDVLLKRVFPNKNFHKTLKCGYGVMFPGVELKLNKDFQEKSENFSDTIEYSADLMYLAKHHYSQGGLDDYLERVKNYWRNHSKYREYSEVISIEDLRMIKDYFRKDLVFEVPILTFIDHDSSNIATYSDQQKRFLKNFISRPDTSFTIKGGAGTGKTILALELAKEKALQGLKTLFVCYNKNLKFYVRTGFENSSVSEEQHFVTFENIHALFQKAANHLNYTRSSQNDSMYFDQELPRIIKSAEFMIPNEMKYDYIIIDEGQDLMKETFMDSLEVFLKGGWGSNNWALFIDPEHQNVFRNFDACYYETFDSTYKSHRENLSTNYRNTRQIINLLEAHSGLKAPICTREGALDTNFSKYKSFKDLMVQLSQTVSRYLKSGISNNRITVISSRRIIIELMNNDERFVEYTGQSEITEQIFVTTPFMYKGIENDVVVYVLDSESDLNGSQIRSEIYISYSRAKSVLEVIIPFELEKEWSKFVVKNMKSS
tara:strand:- start:147259 stop:149040 length:1782 start_codon:yes stop_codon:yes gene_type:complete